MQEESKNKIIYWLAGVFMGMATAVPITAYITAKFCEKSKNEALANQPIAVLKKIKEEDKNGCSFEFKAVTDDAYAEPGSLPSEEDINDYNLAIDDEEASAAVETSIEDQERFRDMIQRYNGDLNERAYMIDAEKFELDNSYGKAYVNWYTEDNVFEEDLIRTPYPISTYGVSDGSELFKNDDNVVYVRNDKLSTDFEITRVYGSYNKLIGGGRSDVATGD